MNASQHLVTHECMNCGQHHPLHLVRQILPQRTPRKVKLRSWSAPAAGATTSISWRLSEMNTEAVSRVSTPRPRSPTRRWFMPITLGSTRSSWTPSAK